MKYKPPKRLRKNCSNCGKPLEDSRIGKQRYCKACHAEYMRKARKLDPKVYGTYRSKPVEALLEELKSLTPNWENVAKLVLKVEKSKL